MIAYCASVLLIVVPCPPPAPPASAPPWEWRAQDPPADDRADVEQMLSELEGHASARGKEDREAIAVIDKLLQVYGECGPKDRGAIIKGLDKCFKEKRQENEEGARENQLYLAAATALGKMAPESVDVLLSWVGHKSHRKDLALQRVLILNAGKTKSDKAVKPLLKLLDDHEAQIQSAAAEGLGEYGAAPLSTRKEVFEELLKLIMSVKNAMDADPTDTIPKARYDQIAAAIITSLQKLSGHNEHDPQNWQHWWNKNKKEDWDKRQDA